MTGPLGLLVFGFFAADKALAEFNKSMLKGVGAGGTKDLAKMQYTETKVLFSEGDTSGFTHSLMLGKDAIDEMMSSLHQAGMAADDLGEGVKTTATAALDFGMTMDEAAGLTGDYYKTYGKSIATIADTFAGLNSDINDSGMTAVNFLSILQSLSAQMNLFLDSTKEVSKAISAMGASGAYSTKQIGTLMEALTRGGTKDIQGQQQFAALYGGTDTGKNQFKILRKLAIKQLEEAKANGATSQEQVQLTNHVLQLDKAISGNTLDAAMGMSEALTPLQETSMMMQQNGINTADQAQAALENGRTMAVMAAKQGVSVDEMKLMVKGQQVLLASFEDDAEEQKKLADAHATKQERQAAFLAWQVGASGKDAAKQADAREDAERVAGMSTSKLKGLGEITNGLLSAILSVIKFIAGGSGPDATLESGTKELNEHTQKLIDEAKEDRKKRSDQALENAKGAKQIIDSMQKRMGPGTTNEMAQQKVVANKKAMANLLAPPAVDADAKKPAPATPVAPPKVAGGGMHWYDALAMGSGFGQGMGQLSASAQPTAAPGYVEKPQSVAGATAGAAATAQGAGGTTTQGGGNGEIEITLKGDADKMFEAYWKKQYRKNNS